MFWLLVYGFGIYMFLYTLIVPGYNNKVRRIEFDDFVKHYKDSFNQKELELYNKVFIIKKLSSYEDNYSFEFRGQLMTAIVTENVAHVMVGNVYANDIWEQHEVELISKILIHKINCQF